MFRALYTVIFYLIVPLILLRLLWRALKSPDYAKRWLERFGFVRVANQPQNVIWVHAVSVGETLAAVPLINNLKHSYPGHRILITCMTPTGSDQVRRIFSNTVDHCYVPYDIPDAVTRFLKRIRPQILVIMETELWPNTIAACRARGIPVVLANGRLSEKSFQAYRRVKYLVHPMMNQISFVVAQYKQDADRFLKLGVAESALSISGNIKFDLTLDESTRMRAEELSTVWRGVNQRPILLAASTHKGEDQIILTAFQKIKDVFESALLVIVPRHPERFDEVAALCNDTNLTLVRRSQGTSVTDADILLGDTMGELMLFFGACDVTFVGGSLVPTGGHNIIEPAAWGVPILTGPHLFNFAQASALLIKSGGLMVCDDSNSLARQFTRLLQDHTSRRYASDAARRVAESNRGALSRLLNIIKRFI
ncbi:MAG: lipid IV(A) 3-deoxy-D-manno-octulosonic acid transferase [Porticoccaceae bacterium]|nr:lipid IV(A) 3-deoxy-D-manno-octulosonic acid transferase [Porticoccaceae bacterium]MDG1473323.1 lipid IV(A) 3-deoxy-D-manno-octulosonic acid transferase [Porticoccaceae bacterium]